MNLGKSTKEDIPEIFRLYELATEFQKLKFPKNHWPQFDPALVSTEVADHRQFKIIIDGAIACVWAITYSDPQIWETAANDTSIFIHRIATNPDFRGSNFVKIIVDWARNLAKDQNKRFIRMDTCGRNKRLIQHYETCGFQFLEIKKLKNASNLPSHYDNAEVCFFEIDLLSASEIK